MTWPAHPDDEWIDVTPMGSLRPIVILGVSGAEREIGFAREQYAVGQITLEDFERVVDRVAAGATVTPIR